MVKWGILGTGSIAKTFAKALNESNQSELSAVASRSDKNANEFSSLFNCLGYSDYQQLIDSKSIDAIYIATPHPFHFDLAFRSLKNKKSVLCEKPMTLTAAEVMVLMYLAKKNNTLLMEAFMYRMHPQTEKIKDILKKEFLGKPVSIRASFGFQAKVDKSHRLLNPILGGGSILDIGCYPLSMARMVAGVINGKEFLDPIRFDLESKKINGEGIDLYSSANLTFSDNSTARISSSIEDNLENTVVISNGQKSLIIHDPWHCGEYNKEKSDLVYIDSNNREEVITFDKESKLYVNQIDHFVETFKNSKIESDKISLSDSYGNAIYLDKWRKETGVRYGYDKPDNKSSSFYKFLPFKNEKIIPKDKVRGLNIEASRLVFGCDNQLDINHAFAMFDHFFSLGGNVFDTAYIYNSGKSDEYLGKWLSSRQLKNEVIILGKGAHTPDCFPESIRTQLIETLSRLNLECLDIYCLHRDNHEVPVGEFIDALDELKNDGLIKIYGASNWSLNRFKESIKYSESKKKDSFSLLSNNFSLARMNEPVWPGCESCSDDDYRRFLVKENIPIFPWSSQARGFFLGNTETKGSYHPANPDKEEQDRVWSSDKNLERRKRCFSLAKKMGFKPIEIALAYVLNQDFPSFPLIGPRNFFETESSVRALEINFSEEEIKWLDLR